MQSLLCCDDTMPCFVLVLSLGLIRWSHDPNVSVPQMASLLLERSQNDSWLVVFKALISTHTLINYGSEVLAVTGDIWICSAWFRKFGTSHISEVNSVTKMQ